MNKVNSHESVINVSIHSLKPFEDFPFGLHEDDSMAELVSSIKHSGVTTPLIVIPSDDGGFEIISGHRRKKAAELAGLTELPVLIKHYSREEAIISMVDSNIQRDTILPSEKAKAYKMKFDAYKIKEGRPMNGEERSESNRTIDEVAKNSPDKARTIQRYIKLLDLIPEIMEMVDKKELGMTSAVELAYLTPEEQRTTLTSIETEGAPSLSQAQKIHRLSEKKQVSDDSVFEIMCKPKKAEENSYLKIPIDSLYKYFSKKLTPDEIKERLFAILERELKRAIAKRNQER